MILIQTIALLALSNVFMTLAWYWHLKGMNDKPWYVAAMISWGIALAEYLLQVPANRLGHARYDVSQLKILQEVIALSVFVPVALIVLKEEVRWDYLWAALCVLGAVFFIFRGAASSSVPQIPQVSLTSPAAAPDNPLPDTQR